MSRPFRYFLFYILVASLISVLLDLLGRDPDYGAVSAGVALMVACHALYPEKEKP